MWGAPLMCDSHAHVHVDKLLCLRYGCGTFRSHLQLSSTIPESEWSDSFSCVTDTVHNYPADRVCTSALQYTTGGLRHPRHSALHCGLALRLNPGQERQSERKKQKGKKVSIHQYSLPWSFGSWVATLCVHREGIAWYSQRQRQNSDSPTKQPVASRASIGTEGVL